MTTDGWSLVSILRRWPSRCHCEGRRYKIYRDDLSSSAPPTALLYVESPGCLAPALTLKAEPRSIRASCAWARKIAFEENSGEATLSPGIGVRYRGEDSGKRQVENVIRCRRPRSADEEGGGGQYRSSHLLGWRAAAWRWKDPPAAGLLEWVRLCIMSSHPEHPSFPYGDRI